MRARGHAKARASVSSRWGWGPGDSEAMLIYGINPVLEALRAKRVTAVRAAARADDRLAAVLQLADQQGIRVRRVNTNELDRAARGRVHQGVVADTHDRE